MFLFFSFSFQVSAQWHIIPSGTTNTLSSVSFINSDVGYISGGYGLIKITTNGGLDWVEQNSGTVNFIKEIFFVDSLYGWACGNGIILKTTNGGVNWSPRVYTSDVIFYDIEFSDSLNGIVVGGGWNGNFFYELLKTTDGGVTWNAKYVPNTSIIQAVHFVSDSCVFIAGWGGRIHKSTDGGNTWEMKSSAFSQRLSDIDFLNDSTGFIVGESGFIVKTTDSGETWTLLSSGVQDWLNAVFIVDPQVVFVVGNNGLFLKSSDFGQSWQQQFGLNLPHLHDVLLIDKMDGWIVGDGGIILHTTNGGVTFIEDEKNNSTQPKGFLLQQNYPNPFNPSTSIQYAISSRQFVTLKVYDVLGKEIATLVNEEKSAGSYNVEFRIQNLELSSGIYFYQLKAGDYVETKKMILLK